MQSNTEWQMWGKADPLWGVASWKGKERSAGTPWTDAEFYELGRSDWEDFQSLWRRYSSLGGTVVEIGCGAGRLTKHIADAFAELHAIDVSADMLQYAKRIGRPNVAFYLVDGYTIPVETASVDAVFSAHVFQHLDGLESAMAYFRDIARVLRNGGSLMVHLPISAWPEGTGRAIKALFELRRRLIALRAKALRGLIRRGYFVPLMTAQSFPMEYLHAELPKLGFKDVEVSIITTRSNAAVHPFVLAIKA
jgi:ubiquinone/menaquinone biosynthesis C-methylase UbiE